MKDDVVQRLREAIKQSGRSDRDVSIGAGMSPDAVRGVMRNQSPTVETVRRLASELRVPAEWIAFGVGETSLHDGRDQYIPIKGEVAAGLWIEASENHWSDQLDVAPVAFTPEWPREAQFGLRVRGTSINRRANEGDILRCIDVGLAGIEPLDGDLVIVQRERADGLQEVTAKIASREGHIVYLRPDSTDERHKPIVLDGDAPVDGVTVRIVAVVDLVLKPMRRRR